MAAVTVVIRGETEPLQVELYHPKAKPTVDAPIARCTVPCRATIPAGRYKLYVHEGDGTVSGSRLVDLTHPTTVTVSPKSTGQRTGGLLLGIGGAVMATTGLVLAATYTCLTPRDDVGGATVCDEERETAAVALLLGGLVATPIGWIMFANAASPGVTQSAPQFGFAPTLFPSHAGGTTDRAPGFAFTGRF